MWDVVNVMMLRRSKCYDAKEKCAGASVDRNQM